MVEHPNAYFGQWIPHRSGLLMVLESEAQQQDIPIVGPVVGKLLYLLGNACRSNHGRLTTFEAESEMAARAARNIEKAGLAQWVSIQCQDALKGLETLTHPADMIFMDIEKEDYERALPLCKEKLCSNGLLVADNTGFKDAHGFNQAISEDSDWESVNLWAFLPGHSPINDGLCIALKRS